MIRVGPAGWDYPDWQGIVYPKPKPKGFDPLAYLCRYFKTVEINSTFYRPPSAKVAGSWVDRVSASADFRFTAKLWKRFTHERSTAWTGEDVTAARQALDVMFDKGRLGAVLLQFPWSFRNDDANQEWLSKLFGEFGHLPLVLEVRHASWNQPQTFEWLTEHDVGVVNIDQPLFHHSIKPAAHSTSAVGYVRLHGRNFGQWFRKSAGRDERYDYLYPPDELQPWVDRIKQITRHAQETYAVTNNHPRGQATANAEMIEAMLTGKKVEAPPGLFDQYARELEPYATRATD